MRLRVYVFFKRYIIAPETPLADAPGMDRILHSEVSYLLPGVPTEPRSHEQWTMNL